ncbi:LysR substrate-binding domain-containing protein [Thauera chlorobenzoica]|uniref:Transcriptional regulator ligR, LysR family n=1 Tax=Thauera chlorobenzoica TaxID=96773 RepID=A0A1H5VTL2_9RHOO|nr:LysR substrate-binding domain-containing protein [Thauera chlorobenzoica]APR03915.1 Transcriptional regulator ligR, LysR family [Thauera chlorobenzoica]SEF90483.1 transcriptional regulator, LysR family [Thauera chlorobenzoica]
MDLKQLAYFVRVAELGSFTRASIALDIAQPALSRQVRLLEVELHQNLLVRNGRGVTLTEAGSVLLEHSRGVLHQIERLREELSRVRGALSGRVAVGMPPSLSKRVAVPVTRAFRSRMPDAALSIIEGLSVTMQESLVSGRLDIALVYNATPSPDIDLVPLLDEALFLIQRSDDPAAGEPIALKDLARQPLVIPSRPNSIRMLVETELGKLGLHPEITLEIDGVPTILDLVADGAGRAVLTRNAVLTAANPSLFATRPIVSPQLQSRLSLALSSRRPSTGTQRAMLNLLEELVPQLLTTR